MTAPQPRPRRRKPLDAGPFAPEIGSFRLHLAAEGKAAKTVRTYTEAVQWFAAAHLVPRIGHTRWDQVSGHPHHDGRHVRRAEGVSSALSVARHEASNATELTLMPRWACTVTTC
jgi:hypothetical protein